MLNAYWIVRSNKYMKLNKSIYFNRIEKYYLKNEKDWLRIRSRFINILIRSGSLIMDIYEPTSYPCMIKIINYDIYYRYYFMHHNIKE
jgi:hypothetical protein